MIEISLTEFVDFAVKSGTGKLTEVRRIKKQHGEGYHPSRDYWCKLRDGIVGMHQNNRGKSALDAAVSAVGDGNKASNYPKMAAAYKKFMGRKSFAWFSPPRGAWQFGDLTVRINPELGVKVDGDPHLVKLYFKETALSRDRIAIINYMMLSVLGPKARGAKVAMLDVRNSRLYAFDKLDRGLVPLLEGEALAFCRMYQAT